jgi:hypothetical protein
MTIPIIAAAIAIYSLSSNQWGDFDITIIDYVMDCSSTVNLPIVELLPNDGLIIKKYCLDYTLNFTLCSIRYY